MVMDRCELCSIWREEGKKISYLVINVGFRRCIDMHRTDGMFDIILQHFSDLDESTVSWGKDLSVLRSVYCGLVLCRFLILFIKQLLWLFFMPTWIVLLFFIDIPVCMLLFGFLMTLVYPLQILYQRKIVKAHILNFPIKKVCRISCLQ